MTRNPVDAGDPGSRVPGTRREQGLVEGSSGWKPCYLHSRRPALGECERCARPICSTCVAESGDRRFCPPCAKAMAGYGDGAAQPHSPPTTESRVQAPPDRFSVGEITVHPDGMVESPPGEPAAGSCPAASVHRHGGVRVARRGRSRQGRRRRSGKGFRPGPRTRARESRDARRPGPAGDASGNGRPVGRLSRFAPSGRTLRQLSDAVPVAILAGAVTYALWLLLAFFARKWVQTSVLTAGIVVPWALFRGTTIKKSYGKPVYSRSPDAVYTAIASFLVMASLFLVAESLAFAVVYRGTNIADPLSRFLKANTDVLDIVQVVIGFALAFALPFWLKLGERRPESSSSAPSHR